MSAALTQDVSYLKAYPVGRPFFMRKHERPMTKPRILLVDDDASVRDMLQSARWRKTKRVFFGGSEFYGQRSLGNSRCRDLDQSEAPA